MGMLLAGRAGFSTLNRSSQAKSRKEALHSQAFGASQMIGLHSRYHATLKAKRLTARTGS